MSVPDTLGVPLAALPETRAVTQPDAAAIADEAVALDNAAFADRVARGGAARASASGPATSSRSPCPIGSS
jgi:hypothetical protein